MYKPIGFDTNVYPGDKLRFNFSFYDVLYIIRPSEAELLDAVNQAASVNIISVKYNLVPDLIGFSGTIELMVTEVTTPNQIADDIRQQIGNFKTVKGVSITEVNKDDGTGIDDSSIFGAPKVTTTITTVAIAVIFVVILVVFLKLS